MKDTLKAILTVDKDINKFYQHRKEWMKHGIDTIRVDSMNEAIARLKDNEAYLFIAINEDTITDYILHLPMIRDFSDVPIFVFTSNYAIEKKVRALELGADMYEPFAQSMRDIVLEELEQLNLLNRWQQCKINSIPVLICEDILLSPARRTVSVNDNRIHLTRKEFDILHYLMLNKEQIVEPSQLVLDVWHEEGDNDYNSLWVTMFRLRKKLKKVSPDREYIKNERNIGYRMIYGEE